MSPIAAIAKSVVENLAQTDRLIAMPDIIVSGIVREGHVHWGEPIVAESSLKEIEYFKLEEITNAVCHLPESTRRFEAAMDPVAEGVMLQSMNMTIPMVGVSAFRNDEGTPFLSLMRRFEVSNSNPAGSKFLDENAWQRVVRCVTRRLIEDAPCVANDEAASCLNCPENDAAEIEYLKQKNEDLELRVRYVMSNEGKRDVVIQNVTTQMGYVCRAVGLRDGPDLLDHDDIVETQDENERYFYENKDMLLANYLGQWVAIREQKIVANEDSLRAVCKKMYDEYDEDWNAYIGEVAEESFAETVDPRALTL